MSDFVPPPQERQKHARDQHVGAAQRAADRTGAASGVKQQLRNTDGFDAQAALLAPRENGVNRAAPSTPVERTGRGKHEWRMALLGARNHMVLAANLATTVRAQRDLAALASFEHTMDFATDESVLSLAIGETFNKLLGALPSPLSTVQSSVELVGDIYTKAADASRGAHLDAWIEAHRDAANRMSQRQLCEQAAQFARVGAEIDKLVEDVSDQGEGKKQEWETAMTKVEFPVIDETEKLELHLYEMWCREVGAVLAVNLYRTDRNYPGQEEVGRAAQDTVFGGRQISQVGVPQEIRDRLGRLGLDPTKALDLPVEHRHHEREPGTRRWVSRGVTRTDLQEKEQP